jgi:hypothetical protein
MYELDGQPSDHISWGTVERDRYGYVEFIEMKSVPVLFDERPSFGELVARARKELHCHGDYDGIIVLGVLHLGPPPNIVRRMIPIGCEVEWEKYVRSAMKTQLQGLDVFVRWVFDDPAPRGFSPPLLEPPSRELDIDVEVAPTLPDAQSAPNVDPQEIPLTQNHPSKYRIRMQSNHLSHSVLVFLLCSRRHS